jgi:hypothetical protein
MSRRRRRITDEQLSENGRRARRLARVGIGASLGLAVGTAVQVAGALGDVAPALGAAIGAVAAVAVNRLPRRG